MTREFQTSYKKNGFRYQYYFILGNTPILSSAELASVFARDGIAVEWLSVSDEVLVLAMAAPIDPSALMTTLGGVVKIGRILPSTMTTDAWVRSRKNDGRLVVGVSVYKSAIGVANARCAAVLRATHGKILSAKRALKEPAKMSQGDKLGGPATMAVPLGGEEKFVKTLRLVTTHDRILPSVALVTEHILERGGELVVLVSHQGIQLGETIAVQAFHEYRERDMHRPGRDAWRGMLPPKVAKTMVNLGGAKDGGLILDPFCGSGTVLSEAALLGYRTVGSDIAKEAVEDTRKNLEWLQKIQHAALSTQHARLFVSDVRYIADHFHKQFVDAIVTEPYLGPPLTGREKLEQLAKIRHDVTALVTDAFKVFRDVLRTGGRAAPGEPRPQSGRVVIVLPVLGGILLPIATIEKLGWRLVPVVPDVAKNLSGITARGTILYGRADQHLAREISVWTRG